MNRKTNSMRRILKTLLLGVAFVAWAGSIYAASYTPGNSVIRWSADGTTWTSVADNGVGDFDPTTGSINYTKDTTAFHITVLAGTTVPITGTAMEPAMDFTMAVTFKPGYAGGSLYLEFSDLGLGPTTGPVESSFGGTVGSGATLTFKTYASTLNTLFALTTPLATGSGPSIDVLGNVALTTPYSLTEEYIITQSSIPSQPRGGGVPTSGDGLLTLANVPDGGSTIALVGFVLVGVEGLRRRMSK